MTQSTQNRLILGRRLSTGAHPRRVRTTIPHETAIDNWEASLVDLFATPAHTFHNSVRGSNMVLRDSSRPWSPFLEDIEIDTPSWPQPNRETDSEP